MKSSIVVLVCVAITLFVLAVVSNQFKHVKLSGWLLAATIVVLGIIIDRVYIWLAW